MKSMSKKNLAWTGALASAWCLLLAVSPVMLARTLRHSITSARLFRSTSMFLIFTSLLGLLQVMAKEMEALSSDKVLSTVNKL